MVTIACRIDGRQCGRSQGRILQFVGTRFSLLQKVALHKQRWRQIVDLHDEGGYSPLAWALKRGHLGCVNALLEAGASFGRVHPVVRLAELFKAKQRCRSTIVALFAIAESPSIRKYANHDIIALIARHYIWPTRSHRAWSGM